MVFRLRQNSKLRMKHVTMTRGIAIPMPIFELDFRPEGDDVVDEAAVAEAEVDELKLRSASDRTGIAGLIMDIITLLLASGFPYKELFGTSRAAAKKSTRSEGYIEEQV